MSLEAIQKHYGTDKSLEAQGVWVTPPRLAEHGIRFLIARQSRTNRLWANEIGEVAKDLGDKLSADEGSVVDDETYDKTLMLFCRANLLNWEGITDKGKLIPYTPQAGFKLLSEYTDLYDYLSKVASKKYYYQQKEQAELEKKLETTSSGS